MMLAVDGLYWKLLQRRFLGGVKKPSVLQKGGGDGGLSVCRVGFGLAHPFGRLFQSWLFFMGICGNLVSDRRRQISCLLGLSLLSS